MKCKFKAYEGTKPYIFISYSHDDSSKVFPLLESMAQTGYRIWYDDGIEWGDEWPESIATHLYNCAVVIAFHSHTSADSKYCQDEIYYALKQNKTIISIYLEEAQLQKGFEMQLSRYQSVAFFHYTDVQDFLRQMKETVVLYPCLDKTLQSVELADTSSPFPKTAALAILLLLIVSISVVALRVVYHNPGWSINEEGVLIISKAAFGSGVMPDYQLSI